MIPIHPPCQKTALLGEYLFHFSQRFVIPSDYRAFSIAACSNPLSSPLEQATNPTNPEDRRL